ncbi:MAG: hypothetical protein M3071_05145 [Actinomycetota bacterium]|nr:hypothetical protein [Actinomycetota bacterium]
MSPPLTGRVRVGRFVLDVGAPQGTLAREAVGAGDGDADASELAAAISRDQRRSRSEPEVVLGHVEHAEDEADKETAKVERADELFKTLVEGQVDPTTLSGDIDALLGLVERLDKKGRFRVEVRVGRAVSRPLALAGRWLDLLGSLRGTLDAAERAGDTRSAAWATHELGTLHLCAERPGDASELLERAREMRAELNDRPGLAATEHNLRVLCRFVQELIRSRQLRRRGEFLRSPLIIALALLLLGAGAAAGALAAGGSTTATRLARAPRRQLAPRVHFAAGAPPAGVVGRPYRFAYVANGDAAITYAVTAGSVPAGLGLAPGGVLSGTPSKTGGFTLTVTATGKGGAAASRQDTISISTPQAPTVTFISPRAREGTVGVPYTFTFLASGDTGLSYAVTAGSVPAGLTLAPGGVLSGTPTKPGNFPFTVSVTGSGGGRASQPNDVVIAAPPPAPIQITSGPPRGGTVRVDYTFTFMASGSGDTFAAAGTLPPGLSLGTDGTLSGVPTTAGSYMFTVSATAPSGAKTPPQSYTVSIVLPRGPA